MAKFGKFIVFEGLDGCGTTTQAQILSKKLQAQKINHLVTFEPTNNLVGGLIKGALTKQWQTSPHGLQLLFCADRAHHLEFEILPALKKGKHVICDRYIFSTIAFGSLACDTWWLTQLNKHFREPDLTIYLKTDPKTCIKRIAHRGLNNELFEEEAKLKKVEATYDFLAKNHKNTIIVDGNRRLDPIANDIWENLSPLLK